MYEKRKRERRGLMQEHHSKDIRDLIIYTKTVTAHPASFADFPSALHPDIRGCSRKRRAGRMW